MGIGGVRGSTETGMGYDIRWMWGISGMVGWWLGVLIFLK